MGLTAEFFDLTTTEIVTGTSETSFEVDRLGSFYDLCGFISLNYNASYL